MWMIIILLVGLVGFTGNIVSLLRQLKASNEKIIQLLEHQKPKKTPHATGGVYNRRNLIVFHQTTYI
ncbi:hypothetical protein BA81_02025 [Bacillus safensis FO-36b]|nr:hypothetical protein RS87_11965 [Bacillus safensis FO-36b]KDE29229.1 hypothetical protein BA81_02025 [Bacillus safensis FO-36b]KIL21737.1 hypothetical protein B4134_2499 [Bacillus safensis]MDH6561711.1 hypothetical protein [Bacillus sp. TBS-096]OBW52083.1 hypothetical protein A9985_07080 [Bacillus safensis]